MQSSSDQRDQLISSRYNFNQLFPVGMTVGVEKYGLSSQAMIKNAKKSLF
jgi:hypothetical protein